MPGKFNNGVFTLKKPQVILESRDYCDVIVLEKLWFQNVGEGDRRDERRERNEPEAGVLSRKESFIKG